MSEYRSFGQQSGHFFTRAHTQVPVGSIASPAAWRGSDMQDNPDQWLMQLSQAEQGEIQSAAEGAINEGIPLAAINRDNFPLPTLAPRIQQWRDTLRHGQGFLAVRGLPVSAWGEELSALAYWGLGHHLGIPGAQNPQHELLGHVVDYHEEADNPLVRRYRTSGNIDFHCDAADVVGLLCLHTAKTGGQSRFVSSVTVFNEMVQGAPELVPSLFEPIAMDKRGEEKPGDAGYWQVQPGCYTPEDGLKTFYHSEYMRSAERHPEITHSTAARKLLDLYDELCADPELHLDMWLQPGDIQFLSNHTTIHARTEYEDWPEPERKRHLLRLWLSLA